MSPQPAAKDLDLEIRDQIIDAAEGRFRVFGLKKTTMAEIAEDSGMSAANIYRYFENKLDLAAACASRCMGDRLDLLREVVRRPGLATRERLTEFVLVSIRHNHEISCNCPKINELVDEVVHSKPELIHAKNNAARSMLAEILAQGNESGELDVLDVVDAAKSLHSATILFEVPFFVGLYPQTEYEDIAKSLVELMIRGLQRR